MRAASAILIIAAFALLAGCVSPGKRYAYLDIKFTTAPTAVPALPAVNQPTTVDFALRNTFNEDFAGVGWSATVVDGNGATVAFAPTSGAVDIPAFGSIDQSLSFTPTASGTYTVTITLDPANSIAERDETNNVAVLSVVVADHDLGFALPVPTLVDSVTPSAPTSTHNLTLTFAISDTLNPGHIGATTTQATYSVYQNGVPIGLVGSTPASPFTIDGAASSPTLVTVTLPPTGSAGTFVYTVTLATSPVTDEANTANNVVSIQYTVPAGG